MADSVSDMSCEVLISGAGPTGLTAAIELARRGIRPLIIDRDGGPTPLSKAVGIAPHTLDLLEPSGVTERLLAVGLRMRRVGMYANAAPLARIDLERIPHRFNFLLSLPQHMTETIMQEVLAGHGIEVSWNSALKGLVRDGGHWRAQIEGPQGQYEIRAVHVLGADGIHSGVRAAAGIAFRGYVHKRQWSIADALIPDWPGSADSAQAHLHAGGDVGFIIPIGENAFRAVSNTADALARIPGRYTVDKLLRTDVFALQIRQAETYARDGVYLAGDAAHVHSPLGARGMNLGIEDACAFARRYAEGALEGYGDERMPVARRWIAFSERALAGVETSSPPLALLRNMAIRAIGTFPALQKPLLARVAGLKE